MKRRSAWRSSSCSSVKGGSGMALHPCSRGAGRRGRMRRTLPAFAVWAIVTAAVVIADGQDRLNGGLGLVVFAAATVPATALLVVAGLGVRRLVPGTAGLVMVGLALVAVLASTGAAQVDVDHHPRHPKLVDERDGGEFAGLHVGRPVGSLARFGRVETTTLDDGELAPLGESASDVSGPSSLLADGWELLRARHLVVFRRRGRIAGYLTTDPAAQLRGGVGIGDSLELVRERYAGFRCEDVTLGSASAEPAYRACSSRVGKRALLWLGGDPIDTIWVYNEPAAAKQPGPPRPRTD